MRKILYLFIVTALCGCNAANTKTPSDAAQPVSPTAPAPSPPPGSAATPPAATANDHRPVIVCFGDSLTAGLGVDRAASYPADLQRDLDDAGYQYRVVNMGISGETTKDGVQRIQRVLALHPALVVVEFGGNDGLRGLPIADSERNLDTIVSQLKTGGTHVALAGMTLPSDYGADYVTRFNGIFITIARRNNVPLLPFLLKDVYGVEGDIQEDGIHATAKGNLQIAKNVEALIEPMLRK
jgi:acyl-CoA thioesterase-1